MYITFRNEKLTFAVIVPSMLRYLKPFFDEINLPKLNTCILTAEASPLDLVKSGMVVYQCTNFQFLWSN